MFAVWWLTAFWFFTWVINYGKVRNWFREVCEVGQAGNVYVWAPAEVKILTANASPLVWLIRKAKVGTALCICALLHQDLIIVARRYVILGNQIGLNAAVWQKSLTARFLRLSDHVDTILLESHVWQPQGIIKNGLSFFVFEMAS